MMCHRYTPKLDVINEVSATTIHKRDNIYKTYKCEIIPYTTDLCDVSKYEKKTHRSSRFDFFCGFNLSWTHVHWQTERTFGTSTNGRILWLGHFAQDQVLLQRQTQRYDLARFLRQIWGMTFFTRAVRWFQWSLVHSIILELVFHD